MTARTQPDDITAECWSGHHDSCTGYTEPESDPELCNCRCHDDHEAAYIAESQE